MFPLSYLFAESQMLYRSPQGQGGLLGAAASIPHPGLAQATGWAGPERSTPASHGSHWASPL